MGLDVHKNSVYITEMDNDGNIMDQYEIENNEDAWNSFRSQYIDLKPEIALEMSTTGKYVSVLLRDMGFSVHVADPVKLALIYNTAKKNDKEDSYKLAKLLRLGDLSEVHVPSREADELRSLVRYRKSLGEEMTMIKNRIHAILTAYGISIKATDIFGKKGLKTDVPHLNLDTLNDTIELNESPILLGFHIQALSHSAHIVPMQFLTIFL